MIGQGLFADRLVEIWAPPNSVGSGVTIGARGILTARHVVGGALDMPTGIQVRIVPTGSIELEPPVWVPAKVVWGQHESAWDIALLEVPAEAEAWAVPLTPSPVLVSLDSRPEPGCHAVGFASRDVQTDIDGARVRQTTQVVGTLLPAGQARRQPMLPDGLPPPRWIVLDIETAPPLSQEDWSGISGAPVVLNDGRLAAIVLAASAQTEQLLAVSLSDAITQMDGLRAELDRLVQADTILEVRDAHRYRRSLMLETLKPSGAPRRVNELSSLATLGVKRAGTEENSGFLKYVVRDADRSSDSPDGARRPGLREILRQAAKPQDPGSRRVVLLTGSSATGKSRSAAEAAIAELGDRRLFRPIAGTTALKNIREWPGAELADAVVWLDDVEVYAEPGLRENFIRLLSAGAVVVATVREAQLSALTETGDLQNPAGRALSDDRLVMTIPWRKNWSDAEREEADAVLETEAARKAVAAGKPLGAWAIAGPQLVDKLQVLQRDEDNPEGADLVRVILDWYRTGYTRGIPRALAEALLADEDSEYASATYAVSEVADAIEELARPVFGPVRDQNALLLQDDEDALGIHDYIRDFDAGLVRELPSSMWEAARMQASVSRDIWGVAAAASAANMIDIAIDVLRPLAEQGNAMSEKLPSMAVPSNPAATVVVFDMRRPTEAQFSLGVLLEQRGDVEEADSWYRSAAEAGHKGAQIVLGVRLEKRGEVDEAELWYGRAVAERDFAGQGKVKIYLEDSDALAESAAWLWPAAEAGYTGAKALLGMLLGRRGEFAQAETWLRRSAGDGHVIAQAYLGGLLVHLDRIDDAKIWLTCAAEAGYVDAQTSLAALMAREGQLGAAENWYRRAADAGDVRAQRMLGGLLLNRDQFVEAEGRLLQAAEANDVRAQYILAALLTKQRRSDEAESWLRRAAEANDVRAQNLLGAILEGDAPEEAEKWYRLAADAGDTDGQANLGRLLASRGDTDEAEKWFRLAVEAGQTESQVELGMVFEQRGLVDEAEEWYRRAADAGHADGQTRMGILMERQNRYDEAEPWYRKAAKAGEVRAQTLLGLLLITQRSNSKEGEIWLRQAAEADWLDAQANYGAVLAQRGDVVEAEIWLRRAADADYPLGQTNLAVVLWQRGDRDEAEMWLRRAADRYPRAREYLDSLLEQDDEAGDEI